LVTVALLTLPPLALRPVRLACLIHAANVHSEPGSNPSKMSRSPGDLPPRRAISRHRSPPERVEESDWSHRHSVRGVIPMTRGDPPRGRPRSRPSVSPPHEGRVPVLACHPDIRTPVDPPGRMSSRCTHAGSPQGFLTRRNLDYLVSFCVWLTNAIDRIVKEAIPAAVLRPGPPPGSQPPSGIAPRSRPLDAVGRCKMP
jgi:hypothetical protein